MTLCEVNIQKKAFANTVFHICILGKYEYKSSWLANLFISVTNQLDAQNFVLQ